MTCPCLMERGRGAHLFGDCLVSLFLISNGTSGSLNRCVLECPPGLSGVKIFGSNCSLVCPDLTVWPVRWRLVPWLLKSFIHIEIENSFAWHI